MMGAPTESKRSMWLWILQRVSGAALIVLLLIHMAVLHYMDPHDAIVISEVKIRLQGLTFMIINNLLLGFVIFHAFNGMRNVVYDYTSDPRKRAAVSAVLVIVAIFLFAFAVWAFLPFMLG
jgi:succinate dehydrogenase / fumarate reductase membrane anchor subunit